MYSVDVKLFASSFSVPAKIADEMLKQCSGDQLKVLLCILRNPEIEAQNIAEKTGLLTETVLECADYWVDAGIVLTDEAEINSLTSEKDNEEMTAPVTAPKIVPLLKPTRQEIETALQKSRSLRNLFNEAQEILGEAYGYAVQSVLYNVVFYYGLPQDVANLLVTFAKYAGTTSHEDLLKIAKSWSDNGIKNCSDANDYIDKATKAKKLFSELAALTNNADGLPTFAQYEYLYKWLSWGFKADALAKAHEIMKAEKETGTLNYRNFQYMDKVLKKWHEAGLHTVSEIETMPAPVQTKEKKKPKKETSFDIELAKEKSRDRTRDIGTMKNQKRKRRA